MGNSDYLLDVGVSHRKRFAQYFTPSVIAKFMMEWILKGQGERNVFDPAFGLGAFAENCPAGVTFDGMDIDPKIIAHYLQHSSGRVNSLLQGNYLTCFGEKHSNIICNPPYLRFQKFEEKNAVLDRFRQEYGIVLSGYTNIASAFLVKSVLELDSHGRLAYIMPSEFLNAGYGKQVKALLLCERHLWGIVQLECEQEAFPDATTSLCILLYDSAQSFSSLAFCSIASLDELPNVFEKGTVRHVDYESLSPTDKWNGYFTSDAEKRNVNDTMLVKLSNYGHFSRGIATGANEFFVLRPSQVKELQLEENDYSLCITKSSQITLPIFSDDDARKLASTDSPVYLFNARCGCSKYALSYIAYGEKQGYHERYITRNRTPWYKMEQRSVAPILLNVFSRDGYKVVRNFSSAATLTNYHCFYPNLFGEKWLDKLFLFLLSDIGHGILSMSMRKYGNNLDKFEPNDLNNSLVPSEEFFEQVPDEDVRNLICKLGCKVDVHNELNQIFCKLIK